MSFINQYASLSLSLLFFISPSVAMMSSDLPELEGDKGALIVVPPTQRADSLAKDDASEEKRTQTYSKGEFIEKMEIIAQYTKKLAELASTGKWEEILNITKGKSFTLPPTFLEKGILIQNYFDYTDAVSQAYHNIAKKVDSLNAKNYYNEAITLCYQYIEASNKFKSTRIEDKVGSSASQQMIYMRLGELHEAIFFKSLGPIPSSDLPAYLWKAIGYYEKAMTYCKQALPFAEIIWRETAKASLKGLEESCKANLFKCYLGLIIESSDVTIQKQMLIKAKGNLTELKKNNNLHYFSKKTLEVLEKELQAQELAQKPGRLGKKVRIKFIEKLRNEAGFALDNINAVSSLDETLKSHLTGQFAKFILFSTNDNYEQALSTLKIMEAKTLEKLEKKGQSSNQSDGEKIKKICARFLKVPTLEFSIDKIISCFINNNDIEGALLRAQAFSDLEQEKTGTISWPARVRTAFLKNLMGDHEDWLEIENIFNQKKEELKKQKQVKKTQVHENHIAKIKRDVEKKEARRFEEEQRLQAIAEKNHQEQPKNVIYPNEMATESFETTGLSSEQQRLEKIQRHEMALKQRENDAKNTASQPIGKAEQVLSEQARLEESFEQQQPLRILHALKGLALKVDEEIEESTWKFTRDDLKAYFEALGCVYKPGKGSHSKISLPKAIHVTIGDKLITLFNIEGGALTLPIWADTVPYYLRKQILIARKKISAIKNY